MIASLWLGYVLPALGTWVPAGLAGLGIAALVAVGLPLRAKALSSIGLVLLLAAYLLGWHLSGALGEARLLRERQATQDARIAGLADALATSERNRRMERDLAVGMSRIAGSVSAAVASIEDQDEPAPPPDDRPGARYSDAELERVRAQIARGLATAAAIRAGPSATGQVHR